MGKYNLDSVKVFKYATEENAPIYRAIMRFLYDKHLRFEHYSTTSSDIYQMLRENNVVGEGYTMSNLQDSLRRLETWEAIKSRQEKQKGMTITEFKQKRYSYQVTDLGAEIEELLIRIDDLDEQLMGKLDSRQFSKLLKYAETLRDIDARYLSSGEKASEIWTNVFETHKELRTNASNYLYHIQEAERKNLFNSELFLEFKDTFIRYLGTFIEELMKVKHRMYKVLDYIDDGHIEGYVQKLTETNKPNVFLYENFSAGKFEQSLWNKWNELKSWFMGLNGGVSDIEILGDKTNEAITMIVDYANRLSETQANSQSRIDDYKALAKRFTEVGSLNEAHCLFGAAFGIKHSRSLYVNDIIESHNSGEYTENDHIWNTDIMKLQTPNMSNRGPRGTTSASRIKNSKRERQRRLIEKLEQRRKEEQGIKDLIKDGKIVLAEVDLLKPFQRKVLFKWLMRTTKMRIGKVKRRKPLRTETGLNVYVRNRSKDTIKIKCTDGTMTGPDIEFIIEDEIG